MKRIKEIPHQVGENGSHDGAKPAVGIHSILHIGNFLSSRGVSRQFIEELADRMESHGWLVFRTSFVMFRPGRILDMLLTILRHNRKYRVAHISVFSGRAFLWALSSAFTLRLLQKPFVLSLHGGNLPEFSQRWPEVMRLLITLASAVTCPSNYLLEPFKRFRPDIRLLPNPVEIQEYEFRMRKCPEPRLIWLRAFHRIYNPSLAPRVLSLLLADFPQATLAMVGPDRGDGSFEETMTIAKRLAVRDRIRVVGKVAKHDVPVWLNASDIFINTTNIDNTPTSVLEAMACGLCIVTTDVGGIRYLLEDEHDALLVPPDDPEAMALATRRVLRDPELAVKLSANARKKVEAFDWAIILPRWQQLFSECAGAA